MAKFCKYCGKELKKGEVCKCNSSSKKEQKGKDELKKAKETIKTEVADSSIKYFQKIGTVCKNMMINPIGTVKNLYEENDFILTIILLILSSVILSFCTVSFLKGIYTSAIDTLSFANMYSSSMKQVWNFSYFKILCCVVLGILMGYLLLAVIFQLGFERICKKQVGFKKTLSVIAVSIIEPTIIGMISAFLTIFSYKLSILLILFGILLFLVNLYQNYKMAGEIELPSYNRMFAILILIFTFLAIYLIPNLFL